jgi:hypothetical protein
VTNLLFPGRPSYKGPSTGWFGLLHHDSLFEYSFDVMQRVDYVAMYKPSLEIGVRLDNMVYIDALDSPKYKNLYSLMCNYAAMLRQYSLLYGYDITSPTPDMAFRNPELYASYNKMKEEYDRLGVEVLAYIKDKNPICAWDIKNEELRFPMLSIP